MIHWFQLSNYTSFNKTTRIDLTPGKVVNDYTVFTSPSGTRLNKFLGVFGHNASGKTNLIRAVGQTANFIAHSFRANEDDNTPFVPHFFSKDESAAFSIQFEVMRVDAEKSPDGQATDIFRYEVVANPKYVVRETLKRKTSHLFSRVYERVREEDGSYQYAGIADRYTRELPGNVSLISWLARQDVSIAVRLRSYFSTMTAGQFGLFTRMPGFIKAQSAIDVFRKAPHHHSKMVELLRHWDFGLDDIEFVRQTYTQSDGKEQEYWEAQVSHRVGDNCAKLNLLSESNGTIELFSHLSVILEVLRTGGVAIIDEIDEAMHPNMVEALLDLFMRAETNPRNAQIMFTSHSPWIMDFLNKWQTVLVEKRDGYSEAWRLSDMSGVQNRDNHAARYRAGAYGAVPRDLSSEELGVVGER